MSFAATFITLYPDAFPGRARRFHPRARAPQRAVAARKPMQLREFGLGKHRQVDETPAGGGAGLVLRPDVAAAAIDSLPGQRARRSSIQARAASPFLRPWPRTGLPGLA